MSGNDDRKELRAKLKEKLYEKKVLRNNKVARTSILDQGIKDLGIDKEKLRESLEILNKAQKEGHSYQMRPGDSKGTSSLEPQTESRPGPESDGIFPPNADENLQNALKYFLS